MLPDSRYLIVIQLWRERQLDDTVTVINCDLLTNEWQIGTELNRE